MKKNLWIFCVLASTFVFAQKDSSIFETKLGLGVTFGKDFAFVSQNDLFIYPATFGNIYIPIDILPNFRIEPEFGYYLVKTIYSDFESEVSNFRYGIGLFYIYPHEQTKIQLGGRIGFIEERLSTSDPYSNDENKKSDFYYGLSIGGEYFFSDHFSLGGEAQLNNVKIGSFDPDTDMKQSLISTRALVIIRFYF